MPFDRAVPLQTAYAIRAELHDQYNISSKKVNFETYYNIDPLVQFGAAPGRTAGHSAVQLRNALSKHPARSSYIPGPKFLYRLARLLFRYIMLGYQWEKQHSCYDIRLVASLISLS